VKPVSYNSQSKTQKYFSDKVNQYIHHAWKLKKGKKEWNLEFSDMRKFAKIVLVDTNKIKDLPEIKKLGVDAMSPDFTWQKFQEILTKKSAQGRASLDTKTIGRVLMDQEIIAGIGNIYRSEILFSAQIHPERKVEKLSVAERKKIYQAIKKVLKKAIKLRGTSESDYRDTDGAPGGFQKVLKVYRRSGEKCSKCGIIIARKMLGQRSVFFCPNCQR
jgi:formamidopyrimidine-DNA glycosylase